MIKLIYLLWPRQPMKPVDRRVALLEQCAPKLLESGARYLLMNIDDDLTTVPSPTPTTKLTNPFAAEVSIWVEDLNVRGLLEAVLLDAGFEVAGYRVREHVYTDYGGNEHGARPRLARWRAFALRHLGHPFGAPETHPKGSVDAALVQPTGADVGEDAATRPIRSERGRRGVDARRVPI